jgi:hypothetical protein
MLQSLSLMNGLELFCVNITQSTGFFATGFGSIHQRGGFRPVCCLSIENKAACCLLDLCKGL